MSDERVLAANRELRKLMGYCLHENTESYFVKLGESIRSKKCLDCGRRQWGWESAHGKSWDFVPDYHLYMDSMREVWQVLKDKGLRDKFYQEMNPSDTSDMFWRLLNDLPGQVKAAIKVLKEEQE